MNQDNYVREYKVMGTCIVQGEFLGIHAESKANCLKPKSEYF